MFTPLMVRALIEGLKSQTRRSAIGKTGKPTLWTRVTVGDRLWVRESHRIDGTNVIYRRDGDRRTGRWRPGLHMPRWASRMTLVVQAVRQEAVSRISDADARAEGMAVRGPGPARSLFKDQWLEMHGLEAWADDLPIIVLAFSVVQANIDTVAR